ncbi:DUF4393 domain-containing protein [Cellulosimicrobium cellulans]|uniref:DUF4393 domain-containing protein n=1 Tax=Cellulosimicrobium cellulans TaxID=1710 RepID=UPI0038104B83
MTGAEIVGAGFAAAKGAKKIADALGGDAKEQEQLSRLAEDTKALEVAANARADRVAIRQLVLTKLYAPLAKWVGYKSDYFDNHFADDMAEKLADVPEEHITSPSPIVAAQSMEGLSYSLDEPDLKEMYLNLLATASDDRRAHEAHPSYAQLIKQLAPREAGCLEDVLKSAAKGTIVPIAELRNSKAGGTSGRVHYTHLVNLVDLVTGVAIEDPDYPMFVDNWVRLGLVLVDYSASITREDAYDWVESRPEYESASAEVADQEGRQVTIHKGVMRVTALGKRFYEAVSRDSQARTNGGGL